MKSECNVIYRQEGNLGPFSLADLQQQLAEGNVKPDDLAWHEGMTTWAAVSQILAAPPPGAPLFPGQPSTSAQAIRKSHLKREENIRSIGTYFYFTGITQLVLVFVIVLSASISYFSSGRNQLASLIGIGVYAGIFLFVAGLSIWSAGGLLRLDRSAKVPGIIVAIISLLGFPVGTLISGGILYLLLSEESRFVFSDEYREVVAATPQIQWKTALWLKIFIGLFIFLFLAVVVISILLALGQQVGHIQQQQHP
jgi:hypothetical protein